MKLALLDLNGTLLELDEQAFTEAGLTELENFWKDKADTQNIREDALYAFHETVENTDITVTNQQAFLRAFARRRGLDESVCAAWWEEYYTTRYQNLGQMLEPCSDSLALVEAIRARGYDMALVSNAMDPREAVEARLRWAGLDPNDFAFIASSENMHYCKPRLRFYREVMEKCGVYPEDCIMVGNDAVHDMVPRRLGVPTYFVTDNAKYRNVEMPDCDWSGSRAELADMLRKGNTCRC